MVKFKALLQKFSAQGEKTGWTYFVVPQKTAGLLKANNKTSFRVKGKLDDYSIKAVALIPMGGGDFIMAVNATMRKAIKKIHGATVTVELTEDKDGLTPARDLVSCLKDEPAAQKYFTGLPMSHRNWYNTWVKAAKTEGTRERRIAAVVNACSLQMTFAEMMRKYRDDNKLLRP